MNFFIATLILLVFSNSSFLISSETTKINHNFNPLLTAAFTSNESAIKTFLKNDVLYPKNHPYIMQAYNKTPQVHIKKILATKCDSEKIPQLTATHYTEQQEKLIKLITSCNKKKYALLKQVILETSCKQNLAFIAYHLIEFLYSPAYSEKYTQEITACLQALIDKKYIFQSMPEYAILLYRGYTTIIKQLIHFAEAPHTIILWTLCANFNKKTEPLLTTIDPTCIQKLDHSPLCFLLYTPEQGQLFKYLCKEKRAFMYDTNLISTIQSVGMPAEKNDRLNFLFAYGMHIKPLTNIWFSSILTAENNANPVDSYFTSIIRSPNWKKQLNIITHRLFNMYNREHLQQLVQKAQEYHNKNLEHTDNESQRFIMTILEASTVFAKNADLQKKHFWLLMLRDMPYILGPTYTKMFYKRTTNNQKVKDYMINSSSSYGIPNCKNISSYTDIIIQHTV